MDRSVEFGYMMEWDGVSRKFQYPSRNFSVIISKKKIKLFSFSFFQYPIKYHDLTLHKDENKKGSKTYIV